MGHRIGIGLFGKGSTNHLHRPEIVNALHSKGFDVIFIVRSDYWNLIQQIQNCKYVSCRVTESNGWKAHILAFCRNIRHMYPSQDPGKKKVIKASFNDHTRTIFSKTVFWFCLFCARYQSIASAAAYLENILFSPGQVNGIDPKICDLLILLGVGTVNSELEGAMTLWAKKNDIPTLHVVGNYDSLTTKGFRSIQPDRLLVWGPQMFKDAVKFQKIESSKLKIIGSIRYNSIPFKKLEKRKDFLSRIGLDPNRKTIVFAGFKFVAQYFEMLDLHRNFLKSGCPYQLILRLYPNKVLMNSIYIEPLMNYAKTLSHVYISCGDPHFRQGNRNEEVLQIEEEELWNILCHCDVLVDYYSTIAIEGAIFDKRIIHMHYIPSTPGAYFEKPKPVEFWNLAHNKRILSYGAVDVAYTRNELVKLIQNGLTAPGMYSKERKRLVANECGPMDGKASERLIDECFNFITSYAAYPD